MTDIRPVTDRFAVAPQITTDDIATVAALGYTLVINNRPDGEAPGQPTAAEMAQAAADAGLDYVHIPVIGMATPAQVEAIRAAIDDHDGKVLAYCRSGTRSITAWSLGRAAAGDDRSDLVSLGAEAGYDLSGVLG